MTSQGFPDQFLERLRRIFPPSRYEEAADGLSSAGPVSVRVNTLKMSVDAARRILGEKNLPHEMCPDVFEAVSLEREHAGRFRDLEQFARGEFYQQSLSSMLAAAVLDPRPGENILDLCAAPGSKTSQIAARMKNTGSLTAVDAVRGRFYKMKAVLRMLGVENAECLCLDGRRFEAREGLFDRVLVDAPCSSEGRFKKNHPETFAYWSLRKIREMVKKQRGLLLNAGRQVRPLGVLVYSTCTFAPEENEGVVDWFLRKSYGEFMVDPVVFSDVAVYPAVMEWEGKTFDPQIRHCVRVSPGLRTEGFFITRFRRVSSLSEKGLFRSARVVRKDGS